MTVGKYSKYWNGLPSQSECPTVFTGKSQDILQ